MKLKCLIIEAWKEAIKNCWNITMMSRAVVFLGDIQKTIKTWLHTTALAYFCIQGCWWWNKKRVETGKECTEAFFPHFITVISCNLEAYSPFLWMNATPVLLIIFTHSQVHCTCFMISICSVLQGPRTSKYPPTGEVPYAFAPRDP